jgi:hypothetical protein
MAIQQTAEDIAGSGPGGCLEVVHWIENIVWTDISPECYLCEGDVSLNDCEVNALRMAEERHPLPAELEAEV